VELDASEGDRSSGGLIQGRDRPRPIRVVHRMDTENVKIDPLQIAQKLWRETHEISRFVKSS
jgi:hypothetical protein